VGGRKGRNSFLQISMSRGKREGGRKGGKEGWFRQEPGFGYFPSSSLPPCLPLPFSPYLHAQSSAVETACVFPDDVLRHPHGPGLGLRVVLVRT